MVEEFQVAVDQWTVVTMVVMVGVVAKWPND